MPDKIYKSIPYVTLRGLVVFPKMRMQFDLRSKTAEKAASKAAAENQLIFVVAQRDADEERPAPKSLFTTGVVAEVKQVIRPSATKCMTVIVQGLCRAKLDIYSMQRLTCDVQEISCGPLEGERFMRCVAASRVAKRKFEQYVKASSKIIPGVISQIRLCDKPDELADLICATLDIDYFEKQHLLDLIDPEERLEELCKILSRETELSELEKKIEEQVNERLDRNQREYYIREQISALKAQISERDDDPDEFAEYIEKIQECKASEQVKQKLFLQCRRLYKMSSSSADANVLRNYLDECLSLPWGIYTEDSIDIGKAEALLESEHYGMQKVKQRFIELLAVESLTKGHAAQIICLAGPPGVGKTSIARSVAKAMGRRYVRMSLGGIRDEADIRGHRKTYVGAMPGRLVSAIRTAKSFNPVILLDEIDKISGDYRGNPSAALLEALDPEQNNAFTDHYIEFPIDLSRVLFITTANDTSRIPKALLDRMEVIELPSYTLSDKMHIAREHLIPKQRELHGIKAGSLRISDETLMLLIDGYTREAGVRRLEQLLACVCRKSAVMLIDGRAKRVNVTPKRLVQMLGPIKYKDEKAPKTSLVGVVNGLAWTSVGGELLSVEAVTMPGKGKTQITGNLGDVMLESARAALGYIRSRARQYSIDPAVFEKTDVHIHAPQGAVPKDGPSAGVTIATALMSALTHTAVRCDVAMTGEISLTGRVLPIGGLKEKCMAAYKAGISTVIIPKQNESDLWELDEQIRESLSFVFAENIDQVFEAALLKSADAVCRVESDSGRKPESRIGGELQ